MTATLPLLLPDVPGKVHGIVGFGPKPHEHLWRTVGYGGAGWYLLRCDKCGAKEIG